jgi:hypothetical protein
MYMVVGGGEVRGRPFPQRSWNALPNPSPSASASISASSAGATRLPKEIRRAGARAKLVARTRRRVLGNEAVLGAEGEPRWIVVVVVVVVVDSECGF